MKLFTRRKGRHAAGNPRRGDTQTARVLHRPACQEACACHPSQSSALAVDNITPLTLGDPR